MGRAKLVSMLFVLGFVWISACTDMIARDAIGQSVLRGCQAAEDAGVRFWYDPPDQDSALTPLVLLPTSSQDPRLDSRPAWILYLSHSDLRSVFRVLAEANLKWTEFDAPQRLVVDPFQLPHISHQVMQIAISYPGGSATAEINSARIHPLMDSVYCAVSSSKARDSMAAWTGAVDCTAKEKASSPPPLK
jgi:hypothetical protein